MGLDVSKQVKNANSPKIRECIGLYEVTAYHNLAIQLVEELETT